MRISDWSSDVCSSDLGVVEAELLQRVAQVRELVAVDRVEPAEHHRLGVAVALEGRVGLAGRLGDGLTGAGLAHVLDAGDEVAGLAGTQRLHRGVIRAANADLGCLMCGGRLLEAQLGRSDENTSELQALMS